MIILLTPCYKKQIWINCTTPIFFSFPFQCLIVVLLVFLLLFTFTIVNKYLLVIFTLQVLLTLPNVQKDIRALIFFPSLLPTSHFLSVVIYFSLSILVFILISFTFCSIVIIKYFILCLKLDSN